MSNDSMRRLCVFCGSSAGARATYAKAARALGRAMLDRGLGLVYGGGRVGLMGELAQEVLAGGGEVIGVIPEKLQEREKAHDRLSELLVVQTLFERKSRMMALADAFVAMPGGVGTLDELFEVLTWTQLGFHQKPCGLLDVDGHFEPLLRFLDRLVAERFLRSEHLALLVREREPGPLLERLAAAARPAGSAREPGPGGE